MFASSFLRWLHSAAEHCGNNSRVVISWSIAPVNYIYSRYPPTPADGKGERVRAERLRKKKSRVSEATLGSFPVYKGFKNMGKSTQKVDNTDLVSNFFSSLLSQSHGKSRKVTRLKASKLQEAPPAAISSSRSHQQPPAATAAAGTSAAGRKRGAELFLDFCFSSFGFFWGFRASSIFPWFSSIFPWFSSNFPWFSSMFPLFFSIFPWFSSIFPSFSSIVPWFSASFPWFSSIFHGFLQVFHGVLQFFHWFLQFSLVFFIFPWFSMVFCKFSIVFFNFSIVFFNVSLVLFNFPWFSASFLWFSSINQSYICMCVCMYVCR